MPPVHEWHCSKLEKSDAYLQLNNDVKAYFFFTKTELCACFVDRSNKHYYIFNLLVNIYSRSIRDIPYIIKFNMSIINFLIIVLGVSLNAAGQLFLKSGAKVIIWDKDIKLMNFYNYKNIYIVEGGKTRSHSVLNSLGETEPDSLVMVHDAVRPFITKREILELCDRFSENSSDILIYGIPVYESLKMIDKQSLKVSKSVDRNNFYLVTTAKNNIVFFIIFSIILTNSLLLCEISRTDKPILSNSKTDFDDVVNTSLGRILGPALKLCFFIN